MDEQTHRLNELITLGEDSIKKISSEELSCKLSKDKWSKKEILGHLIDSALNNLQRFTEVQFSESPYQIETYNQDELVKSNYYQKAKIDEILPLWISLNRRIHFVISNLSKDLYNIGVLISSEEKVTLHFLIEDYINHLKHHLNQIIY